MAIALYKLPMWYKNPSNILFLTIFFRYFLIKKGTYEAFQREYVIGLVITMRQYVTTNKGPEKNGIDIDGIDNGLWYT